MNVRLPPNCFLSGSDRCAFSCFGVGQGIRFGVWRSSFSAFGFVCARFRAKASGCAQAKRAGGPSGGCKRTRERLAFGRCGLFDFSARERECLCKGGSFVLSGMPFSHSCEQVDGKWTDRGHKSLFVHREDGIGTGGFKSAQAGQNWRLQVPENMLSLPEKWYAGTERRTLARPATIPRARTVKMVRVLQRSSVREICTPGSARGLSGNRRLYLNVRFHHHFLTRKEGSQGSVNAVVISPQMYGQTRQPSSLDLF